MQNAAVSVGASPGMAEAKVAQLSREVAELRAALEALASGPRPGEQPSGRAHARETRRSGRRRRGRRHGDEFPESGGLVSRRRLFGLLGGAAAAGAGLAVAGSALGADRADATVGTMMFGSSNDAGTDSTVLTSSTTGQTLGLVNTGSSVALVANTSGGSGIPLEAVSSSGVSPVYLNGTAGSPGPPTSGAHHRGELYQDQLQALFYCTEPGTPGTWANLSIGERLVPLSAPVRVFDSRPGQPNFAGNGNTQGPLTFTNPPPSAASRTINCAKDSSNGGTWVPASATALLINLTVIPISGTGALAVFQGGGLQQPSTSSINWSSGVVVLANGTSSVCSFTQSVEVAIVASSGASTNFLIDVVGYYR